MTSAAIRAKPNKRHHVQALIRTHTTPSARKNKTELATMIIMAFRTTNSDQLTVTVLPSLYWNADTRWDGEIELGDSRTATGSIPNSSTPARPAAHDWMAQLPMGREFPLRNGRVPGAELSSESAVPHGPSD